MDYNLPDVPNELFAVNTIKDNINTRHQKYILEFYTKCLKAIKHTYEFPCIIYYEKIPKDMTGNYFNGALNEIKSKFESAGYVVFLTREHISIYNLPNK